MVRSDALLALYDAVLELIVILLTFFSSASPSNRHPPTPYLLYHATRLTACSPWVILNDFGGAL